MQAPAQVSLETPAGTDQEQAQPRTPANPGSGHGRPVLCGGKGPWRWGARQTVIPSSRASPWAAASPEGRWCQPRSCPSASRREARLRCGLVPAPRLLLSQPGFVRVPAAGQPLNPRCLCQARELPALTRVPALPPHPPPGGTASPCCLRWELGSAPPAAAPRHRGAPSKGISGRWLSFLQSLGKYYGPEWV